MRQTLIACGLFTAIVTSAAPASAAVITLNGTARDFRFGASGSPDFERSSGSGLTTGLVLPTLGADGKPQFNTALAQNSITSQATFDQWFRDVAGVNLATTVPIVLNDDGVAGDSVANNGIYTYQNLAFFPIDNQLFGNQSLSHNYHFTYEVHTTFTSVAGQTFDFLGDDDLWVFINNRLVIDLGGFHTALAGSVSLDSLGLTAGNSYSLDLFFAERHTIDSNFRITTNIPLVSPPPVPEPASFMLVGAGLAGALARRRRRSR